MQISETPQTAFEEKFDPAKVSLGKFSDDNDVLLFVHIPKTAGMSVGKALRQAFDKFHPVDWEETAKSFRVTTRDALYQRSRKACRRVLMGHYGWPEIAYWKNQELPIKAASVVREPLARVVSNYNYNCSAKHPHHERFQDRFPKLEDFAKNVPLDYQLNRLIGVSYSFDHALELLCKYYSFLGVTEHLSASLDHLRMSHGLRDLPEHRENLATRPATNEQITDAVRNIVLEKSHNDTRLHGLLTSFYA